VGKEIKLLSPALVKLLQALQQRAGMHRFELIAGQWQYRFPSHLWPRWHLPIELTDMVDGFLVAPMMAIGSGADYYPAASVVRQIPWLGFSKPA
jgi:predicted alpha/beta-fold hydrolase